MPDGSFAPGFSPTDIAYHDRNIGQRFVYSGYWGRPVYESELPAYERAAYGFGPPPGSSGAGGANWQFDGGTNSWYDGRGNWSRTNPNAGGGGGGGMPPGGSAPGGYSGSQPYGGMSNTQYQMAATNAIAQMYNRIRARKQTAVNTDMARRGISSSGVAGGIMGDSMHELDLNESADIAKIWQDNSGGGGGGGGGNPAQGAMGPGNMGGFGMRLPGFLPSSGGSGNVITPGSGGNSGMGQLGGVIAHDPYRGR